MALGKTVSELENEISIDELMDWSIYFESEPIPNQLEDLKNDYRFALLATIFYNAFSDSKNQKTIEDFLPTSKQIHTKQTWQRQLELCQTYIPNPNL